MPAKRKPRVRLDAPLAFEPIYVEKPWGGDRIGRLLDRSLPAGAKVGESWEISGHPGRVSRLPSGESLETLLEAEPEAVLGDGGDPDAPFPLLFKYLDASENLSVQVHPGAPTEDGGRSKDEAWIILDAAPGAVLYLGLSRDVAADELRSRAIDGTLPEVLRAVEPRPGDVFHVSPGTIHAIGAGVVLAEIQQVSDTTYRLFDWGRVDDAGRPRELHLEQAVRHSRLSADGAGPPGSPRPIDGGERVLEGAHFKVDRFRPAGREAALPDSGRFRILTVLAGSGRLAWSGGESRLERGRTVLLPAALGDAVLTDEGGDLVALAFEE